MSVDKTLRSGNTLERHRNVLTRDERIAQLKELGRWDESNRPFGLPKVAHRKAAVGKKAKTKKTEDTPAAEAPAAAGKKPTK